MLQRIIAAQLQVHFYVRLSNIAGEHSRNVSEILQQWSHRNVFGQWGTLRHQYVQNRSSITPVCLFLIENIFTPGGFEPRTCRVVDEHFTAAATTAD